MLLYGERTGEKIEHVRGKIYIRGTRDIKWNPNINNVSLDEGGKGVNSVSTDFATVLTENPNILRFDLAVNEGSDSFIAKFDLGSNGCVDVAPVIKTFTAPQYSQSRTISNLAITTDETTGIDYLITESNTKPALNSTSWGDAKPTTYTVTSD